LLITEESVAGCFSEIENLPRVIFFSFYRGRSQRRV